MYPSGPWRGYWDQPAFGRQPMNDLVLRFDRGVVEGEGRDFVGRFTFLGNYDNRGNVLMMKQYLGKHRVLYRGVYDGEGTLFGTWSIGNRFSGLFALSAVRSQAAPDAPIQDIS